MKLRDSYLTAAAALSSAAVAALLSGCEPANSQPHAGMRPPEVAVVTVQPQSVPATFEYIGQTAGSREVEVRARVTGIVLKRNYREGAPVAQGQSMFTIDPAPFEVAAARAEAALASAEAKLAQAKRNSARLKPLFEIKAASQKDFDDAAYAEKVEGGWVDAKGMFLAGVGAGPVYELLGKKGLGTAEFPPQETALIDGEVAFRQHSGGHTTGPNWPTFLPFAERYIKARSTTPSTEPASHTVPRSMTRTESAMQATTPRLWVMNSMLR